MNWTATVILVKRCGWWNPAFLLAGVPKETFTSHDAFLACETSEHNSAIISFPKTDALSRFGTRTLLTQISQSRTVEQREMFFFLISLGTTAIRKQQNNIASFAGVNCWPNYGMCNPLLFFLVLCMILSVHTDPRTYTLMNGFGG